MNRQDYKKCKRCVISDLESIVIDFYNKKLNSNATFGI